MLRVHHGEIQTIVDNVVAEIYASSAGAVNAADFLAGQDRLGISIHFDSLCETGGSSTRGE